VIKPWKSRLSLLFALAPISLAVGACDAWPNAAEPAVESRSANKRGAGQTQQSGAGQQPPPKGRSFTFSAGSVTLRRVGFDTLRVVSVRAKPGWRGRIDDNFDDSVGVEFFKGRGHVDFTAGLENGRLQAEACQDLSPVGARFQIGSTGAVTLRPLGDEDLHISGVSPISGWRARITDNNSEDVEVLFFSNTGKVEFDAQLDDGRLEGNFCRTLS
jgi:hypothetical protein